MSLQVVFLQKIQNKAPNELKKSQESNLVKGMNKFVSDQVKKEKVRE